MKIIFTVGTYYPSKDGVQAVTGYLAEGLVKLGYQVKVITRKSDGSPDRETYNGVEIIRYNVNTVHAIHMGDIKGYREYVLKSCRFADAIIMVASQIVTTDVLLPVLKDIPCKKILYMHGMTDFSWGKKSFRSLSSFGHKVWNNFRWTILYNDKRNFKKFDRIIQISSCDGAYDFVKRKYGIKSDIIENAADDEFFSPLKSTITDLPNDYALYIANYLPRKNQIDAMHAYYLSENTSYSLIFIGSEETEYYEKLLAKKKKYDCEFGYRDVRILTGIPRYQIAEYVQSSKLYLMSSTWEVFPVSLIEAMAAGIPFITTNVGIARFLPGGVIVNDVKEMSYWISTLIANDATRMELGKTGKTYADKNLTIDQKVKQLEKIIKE